MKNSNKNFVYIAYLKNKKSKQYRCRVSMNGKRWTEYFNSADEANAFKAKLDKERGQHFKKGDFEYLSLNKLFQEWLTTKSFEWSSSTVYGRRKNFFKMFSSLGDKWFNLIDEADCYLLLSKELEHIHKMKYYMAFQTLDELNKYSLNKYKIGLSWSVTLFRKKIKIIRGTRRKSREYHTKDEMIKISAYLSNPDTKIKNREILYHIYRAGISLGCRVGELCSLKKINFNEKEKSLIIDSTISVDSSRGNFFKDSTLTKTKSSRVIRLSDSAVESLKYLSKISKTKYILPYVEKCHYDFLKPQVISSAFKVVLNHLGIIWIGTHGMFRKTFATQIAIHSKKGHRDMIASIQYHLGHKSPQMTLHYIQAVDTNLDDELMLFDLL